MLRFLTQKRVTPVILAIRCYYPVKTCICRLVSGGTRSLNEKELSPLQNVTKFNGCDKIIPRYDGII